MTQDRQIPNQGNYAGEHQKVFNSSFYALLGLHPSASVQEIRRAYRDLSKQYHPDTTDLPAAIATVKFQQLNEAYATLSSPERRLVYDRKIGYSRIAVVQPLPNLHQATTRPRSVPSSSAYLDATDRPLSPGELFALFILGVTFVGCLVLAIAIGITKGEWVLQPQMLQTPALQQVTTETAPGNNSEQLSPTIALPLLPSDRQPSIPPTSGNATPPPQAVLPAPNPSNPDVAPEPAPSPVKSPDSDATPGTPLQQEPDSPEPVVTPSSSQPFTSNT